MSLKRIKCLVAQILMKLGVIKKCSAPPLPESATSKCADSACKSACKNVGKVTPITAKKAVRKKKSS
jgi:hypothetical protein